MMIQNRGLQNDSGHHGETEKGNKDFNQKKGFEGDFWLWGCRKVVFIIFISKRADFFLDLF